MYNTSRSISSRSSRYRRLFYGLRQRPQHCQQHHAGSAPSIVNAGCCCSSTSNNISTCLVDAEQLNHRQHNQRRQLSSTAFGTMRIIISPSMPPTAAAALPLGGSSLLPTTTTTTSSTTRRWISKKRKKQLQKDKDRICPFQVLGVVEESSSKKKKSKNEEPPVITYTEIKKVFLKIAMDHHPDTSKAETDQEMDRHKETFMEARTAFEAIVEGPDGMAILRELEEETHNENFDAWFKEETGHDMPYMDAATMKEVAEMTESSMVGLDRDGGMWTLARMVAASVKEGGDGRSILQLEAGSVRDRQIDGILRRRRRR